MLFILNNYKNSANCGSGSYKLQISSYIVYREKKHNFLDVTWFVKRLTVC